jgi:hypothetical protein
VIDKAHDLRAVGDGTEPVQRAAGRHPALGLGRQVSPVERLPVIQHLIVRQRASDDQIAVLLESLAFSHGYQRAVARHACHASPALDRTTGTD